MRAVRRGGRGVDSDGGKLSGDGGLAAGEGRRRRRESRGLGFAFRRTGPGLPVWG